MRYLLVGVLLIAAAGACRAEWADSNPVRLGMSEDEVAAILRESDGGNSFYLADGRVTGYANYRRVDWLGGEQTTHVVFDRHRVNELSTRYRPFAAPPPWLETIRDALWPPPSPE